LVSLFMLLKCLPGHAMDYGRSGVYDSPMANDYYVKRFGFLFGGGRSGSAGLTALQSTTDHSYKTSIPASIYNPSGLYGLRAMRNSVYSFPQPAKKSFRSSFVNTGVKAKKMVELSPIKMELNRKQKSFSRFMAVP